MFYKYRDQYKVVKILIKRKILISSCINIYSTDFIFVSEPTLCNKIFWLY